MDFLDDELDEILSIFQQESAEILENMDKNLLTLEKNPSNVDAPMHLFRDAHSLKGSARMLGFNNIQNVAHKIEDVLGLVKEKKLPFTSDILDKISKALECISRMISKTVEDKKEYISPDIMTHIQGLEDIVTGADTSLSRAEPKESLPGNYHMESRREPILKSINKIEALIIESLYIFSKFKADGYFENLGEIKEKLKELEEVFETLKESGPEEELGEELRNAAHGALEVSLKIKSQEDEDLEKNLLELNCALDDVASKFSSACDKNNVIPKNYYEIVSQKLAQKEGGAEKEIEPKNTLETEILNQRALIAKQMSQQLSQFNTNKSPAETSPSKEEFTAQDWLESIDTTAIKTLRINSSKLDQLVNQVGDLIVTRIKTTEQLNLSRSIQNEFMEWQKSWNKLGHYIKYFDRKYLTSGPISREMQSAVTYNRQLMSLYNTHSERMASLMGASQDLYKQLQENDAKLTAITTEIEAMIKNMRVLPLATIFHLFPRMVHNIARDKGKTIDFRVAGSDVSVDKKIIEDIKIPLMHIIRNSIDHGIEMPEVRKALGKNGVGNIVVRAKHQENKIIIDIEDDGRGIDVQKIRERALQKGLLTPEEAQGLPEDQIVNLIFYPGFSTEEVVTELSGRGLGLDIVQTKISQLNGRIDVRSQLNTGTITTITLPASMATVKAFIVSEQNQPYAIATSSIKTVLRISPEDILTKDDKNYFIFEKRVVPVFTLSQILQLEVKTREADKYTLMVIESENAMVGVIVEKLLGDQEILHKKLPLPLFKVKNIAGITTLASGEMCLILNVVDILSGSASKRQLSAIVATNELLETEKNNRYKILIVDDSLTTRTLEKNILVNNGYRVCFATNAIDGLHIIESEHPDLVVTDNEMPEMSGLEFVKIIREKQDRKDLPVIVLTSLRKEDWQDKFFEAGVQKYIQKGEFNQEYFLECIGELLRDKYGAL